MPVFIWDAAPWFGEIQPRMTRLPVRVRTQTGMITNEEKILYKDLSYKIIGLAMEVHSKLGYGFLEFEGNGLAAGDSPQFWERKASIRKICPIE